MKLTTIIGCCLLIGSAQMAHGKERDFSQVELQTTQLSDTVYMLQGTGGFAGGNIGVSIGQDGIFLIDSQFTGMATKIRKALSNLGNERLRFVLNSHWHRDHSNGNIAIAKDSTIIAHSNTRKRLMTKNSTAFGTVAPLPEDAWPMITFDTTLTFHFNGDNIKLIHYPGGHTDGDVVVYFPNSRVIHMGDLFFVNTFPFVDLDNGGNVLDYTRNIEEIIRMIPEDVKIIAGHGPLATKNDLQEFHKMLQESTFFILGKIESGLSLESIQDQGLPATFAPWGQGFIDTETWITMVHRSILAKQ